MRCDKIEYDEENRNLVLARLNLAEIMPEQGMYEVIRDEWITLLLNEFGQLITKFSQTYVNSVEFTYYYNLGIRLGWKIESITNLSNGSSETLTVKKSLCFDFILWVGIIPTHSFFILYLLRYHLNQQ